MKRVLLGLLLLAACGKHKDAAGTGSGSAVGSAVVETGSGSAVAEGSGSAVAMGSADGSAAGSAAYTPAADVYEPIKAAIAAPDRSEADRALDAGRKPGEVLTFFGIKPGQR